MEFAGFQVWTISETCVNSMSKTVGNLLCFLFFLLDFHDLGLELHPEVEESRLGRDQKSRGKQKG